MKWFYIIILMPIIGLAQYPTTDHFDATLLNNWNQTLGATADAGWNSSTDICVNISGDYLDKEYYRWESPVMNHTACSSIDVTFSTSFAIRNNDVISFCWNNSGWTCFSPPFSGAWTLTLPATTTQYSLDLNTIGNGTRKGKFAHFDYVTTECNIVLPVDFIDMHITCNSIEWVTATETNNDYYTLQYSNNGYIWRTINVNQGGGTLNTPSLYEYKSNIISGYYRLIQTDYNGVSKTLSIKYISCFEIYGEPAFIYNALGKQVPKYTLGYIILVYPNGSVIKNMFKTKEEWYKYLK